MHVKFCLPSMGWIPMAEHDTIQKNLSNSSLFPAQAIPLRKWLQVLISKCCIPPRCSLECLDQKPNVNDKDSESHDLEKMVEKLKSDGNEKYKDGHFKEAVDAYTSAIDMSKGTPAFNPVLLTNRASAFIKLNQLENALKDANEYITRFPDCWKGYARKALALNEKVSAAIAATLAYYYRYQIDGKCILECQPFERAFPGLKERISICDTVEQFDAALIRQFSSIHEENYYAPVIILGSNEYVFNSEFPKILINCIMVGAKPDASVTLKLEGSTQMSLLKKCMFANISFVIDQGQVIARDDSWVKILDCNFTSNNDVLAAFGSVGTLNAERCTFSNCKAGGLLCEGPGEMVVDSCSFTRNMKAGLEVRKNGILTVRNSRIYNN